MKNFKKVVTVSIIAFLFILNFGSSLKAEKDIVMLTGYFDLLTSENFESASYFWAEESRERATKFGIEYDDIPLKVDCVSPIIRNYETMRYFLNPAVSNQTILTPIYSKLTFSSKVKDVKVEHDYYTKLENKQHWLIYPQDYYSQSWPAIESKYFKIVYHYNLESYLNQLALDELDRFVEKIGNKLGITADDMTLLEKEKISYYFCDTDETIQNITGYLVKGTFDLASNDIISAFFPHYHEITHFLINYKLRKLPLYTLPFLREGTAVNLGGRWGKAPSALQPMSFYLYHENFVELDSILSWNGFEKNASTEIAYLVAGLFNKYLTDKIDINRYLELYRKLSGDSNMLKKMSVAKIKDEYLKATLFSTWGELKNDFDKYLKLLFEEKINIQPGAVDNSKVSFTYENVTVYEDGDWVGLQITSLNETPPKGNILFGFDEQLDSKNSLLLNEHYKGSQPFEGFRYGIRYDQNEIGLYDYSTNYLLAKYIWGITPSDDYYNKDENKIYIKFKRDVISQLLDKSQKFKILTE